MSYHNHSSNSYYMPNVFASMMPFDDDVRVRHASYVELQAMPHAAYIRRPGEDWAGITNQKERKKLQNRLNKRISRQRKKIIRYKDDSSRSTPSSASSPGFDAACLDMIHSSNGTVSLFSNCSQEDAARNRAMLNRFAEQALKTYMQGDPCADHHLQLIQFNIISGFTKNATLLGYKYDWLICAAISPFGRNGPSCDEVSPTVPSSLVPTSLQLSTTHHPWLDLFPFPKLRDNMLVALSFLSAEEEQQLFDDIMESNGSKSEWTGLVVWGEPWDPQSWEVSVPFLKRWAWLINGCPEILESTNHWRQRRGERPITPPPGFVVEEV